MSTKNILLDDASFTIKSVMPSEVGNATGCKIDVINTSGTYIVTAADATIGRYDVTTADCEAGGTSVVIDQAVISLVDPHTPVVGEVFLLGNDSLGYQSLTVRHYLYSSNTITTEEFIDYTYPVGSLVLFRGVSYALDTTAAAWDDLDEVTVVWSPVGVDAVPWSEKYGVVKRASAIGGLEQEFRNAFPRYYENIITGGFAACAARARQRLKIYFESRGRNFDTIIDSEILKEPTLIQIAIIVALASSTTYESERLALQKDLDDLLGAIDKLSLWDDKDQDLTETDEETQTSYSFKIVRGL
jgi:hypothetical protein